MIYPQTALLAAILAALVMILRRPYPPAPAPLDTEELGRVLRAAVASLPVRIVAINESATVAPLPPDPTVWEVCQRHGHELRHVKFVREGTEAFEHAFGSPGMVLKQGDVIQEGVQDVG